MGEEMTVDQIISAQWPEQTVHVFSGKRKDFLAFVREMSVPINTLILGGVGYFVLPNGAPVNDARVSIYERSI